MAGDKSNSTSCYMHSDTATGEDSLGFKPYVEAIVEFLTAEETLAPITLSIEGQWGCGKSSFMQQLKKKIEDGNVSDKKKKKYFEKRKKYFTVWFNCWRYEKEDELWAAFALNFMEQLSEQLSWGWRQWAKIKLVWRRLKFKWKSSSSILFHLLLRVVYIAGIILFWAAIIYYSPRLIELLFSYSSDDNSVRIISNILVVLTASVGFAHYLFSFGKDFFKLLGNPFDFSMFVQNSNYTEHISFIEHFHSDFDKIIESYVGNSKVYVFVDDLDRCEVPKAAELMQALNLMISDKANVYFSIGIDRKVISAGLAAKNEKVLKYLGVDGLDYGYDYIEKFIQLPFKVPSPKNEDFKEFMNPKPEKKSPSKTFWLSDNPLSKNLMKLFSKFKATTPSSQPGKGSIPLEGSENFKSGEEVPGDAAKEEPEKEEKITNDKDCDDKSVELDRILEMVAPALDRNPRRMKQFFNLFRFQRTIGKRTALFSYDPGTAPEKMWNCRKLAKFVAISMKWPELVSALGSNSKLFDQLQEYALKPESENKSLEQWTKDEKLIGLLRYGCEGNDPLKKPEDYTLSGLDFSKLLQISPVVAYLDENLSSSLLEMEFVRIPAGDFMMGSLEDEIGRYNSEVRQHKDEIGRYNSAEGRQHKVNIKNPFYLGKYPVTQRQWEKVMGSNPSYFKGYNLPVESVSWDEVQEFIKKLNEMEGTDKYCLPSEAEWEYACRAGTNTKYSFGDDELKLEDYAWYSGYSIYEEWDTNKDKIVKEGGTHPVGQKKSNPWDLYDMHGNVWEWVQDRWHDNYTGAPSDGSAWEDGNSSYRVVRGGGWYRYAGRCRSAARSWYAPGDRYNGLGFRLLRKM